MYRDGDGSKASAYDGLNRLTGFSRGTLTVQSTPDELSIASDQRRQQFGYDGLGNWLTFNSDDGDGTAWDLDQSRTNNAANEITGITETANDPVWVDPAYDKAGSMISGPKPGAETEGHGYVYDAWNRLRRTGRSGEGHSSGRPCRGSGFMMRSQSRGYGLRPPPLATLWAPFQGSGFVMRSQSRGYGLRPPPLATFWAPLSGLEKKRPRLGRTAARGSG
jgi:hypothetical protein